MQKPEAVCLEKNEIKISDHFTYGRLLRYTVPSIVMMIFSSVYSVVDGLFVSNFAGKTPFAAINFIMPYLMILSAGGFMLGTGGNAYISKLLGEQNKEQAQKVFSLVIYTTIIGGAVIVILGQLLLRPIAILLGAEGDLLNNAVLYGRIVLCGGIPFMLQMEFQSLFSTAGKPKLGLAITVAAGVSNIVLDALLIGVLKLGLVGAAAATTVSMSIGGIVPVLYFTFRRDGDLTLVKTGFYGKALGKICTNGMSEMVTNISMSLVSMIFNAQLIRIAGEDGVAAYGVLMYVNMIFLSAFMGYSMGAAPIVGYNFGAKNTDELRSVFRKSLALIVIFAVSMVAASYALSMPLSKLFTGYDDNLYKMTLHGFMIYSLSFLFAGVPIFGSSFFTALSNGKISATISFLRVLVFEMLTVLILPIFFGINGVWWSIVFAEMLAAIVTVAFLAANRKKYQYV